MTIPSEIVMGIRILKALGTVLPEGPGRHFIVANILKKLKKPNAITGKMLWRFLVLHYGVSESLAIPNSSSDYICFMLDEYLDISS